MSKAKGFASVRGYYTRAKVFGILVVAIAIGTLTVYFFPNLLE